MSKLRGRAVVGGEFLLGDIKIGLKPMPFQAVREMQAKYKELEKTENQETMLDYMQEVLTRYTDLEADDFGLESHCVTFEEASGLFEALIKSTKDPKALGLQKN